MLPEFLHNTRVLLHQITLHYRNSVFLLEVMLCTSTLLCYTIPTLLYY